MRVKTAKYCKTFLVALSLIFMLNCTNSPPINNACTLHKHSPDELILGTWAKKRNGNPAIRFTKDTMEYLDPVIAPNGKFKYIIRNDTLSVVWPGRDMDKFLLVNLNKDILVLVTSTGIIDTAYRK